MAYLTDGFVAEWFVREKPRGTTLAKRLVDAGLWKPGEKDGDQGWWFHDWKPECTKSHITAARENARQRKAKSRESRGESRVTVPEGMSETPETEPRFAQHKGRHKAKNDTNFMQHNGQHKGGAEQAEMSDESPQTCESSVLSRVTGRVTERVSPPSCLDPTQPNPTQPIKNSGYETYEPPVSSPTNGSRGTRLPDGWEPSTDVVAQMRSDHPHVDLKAEHLKFVDYWQGKAGKDARKADWTATWRNWIRRAAEQQPARNGSRIPASDAAFAQAQALKNTPSRLEIDS